MSLFSNRKKKEKIERTAKEFARILLDEPAERIPYRVNSEHIGVEGKRTYELVPLSNASTNSLRPVLYTTHAVLSVGDILIGADDGFGFTRYNSGTDKTINLIK